jgi:DNA polymerase-3 subunit epsilon
MNTIFVFDTETTGIPKWKIPSDDPSQPHIVQVCGLIVDTDTSAIIQTLDVIVQPDGWTISPEMTEIHGITHERAMDVGLPESLVAAMVIHMAEGRKRVAFNTTFDNRIIRIAAKRFFDRHVDASGFGTADAWSAGEYECAMIGARKIMGGKTPTLSAAYWHFAGTEINNAHTALADARAAMKIWFAIHAEDAPDMSPSSPSTESGNKTAPVDESQPGMIL